MTIACERCTEMWDAQEPREDGAHIVTLDCPNCGESIVVMPDLDDEEPLE